MKQPSGRANGWIANETSQTSTGRQRPDRTHRRGLSPLASGPSFHPGLLLSRQPSLHSRLALLLVGHEPQRLRRAASGFRGALSVAVFLLDEAVASGLCSSTAGPCLLSASPELDVL